ncbi:MAG: ATP-binding protein, partial [Lachnospiraceae bacterium]|nr:ATP-binding protein [Lachnospiraceae bacterium]
MFNNEDYQFILHEIKNHVCLINSSIQLIEKKYPTVQELNGWDMVTSNVTSLKNLFYEINNTKTCNTISKKEINIYTFMEDFKKSITPLFSYAS